MLVGMACFSCGVFNNALSESYYKKLLIYGFGIGFPLSIMGLFFNYYFDWHWKYLQFFGRTPNHLATPFIAFGYISMIMLWIRQDNFKNIKKYNYTESMFESKEMYELLINFYKYGFVIIKDVPTNDNFIVKFANSIGSIRRTNFGEFFNVKSVPNPNDLAYTSLVVRISPIHL